MDTRVSVLKASRTPFAPPTWTSVPRRHAPTAPHAIISLACLPVCVHWDSQVQRVLKTLTSAYRCRVRLPREHVLMALTVLRATVRLALPARCAIKTSMNVSPRRVPMVAPA